MSEYQNCWEFARCGRELNGRNAERLGVCPAATEKRLHGVHGGVNGGRSCWVVAGTYCHGKVQGMFAQKYATCQQCDFYKKVQRENFRDFQVSVALMQRLRQQQPDLSSSSAA
jgi:hypothetical protein